MRDVMMITVTIAAMALALLLGVAVATTLSERALRPRLMPVPARRRIRRR